jgi:hypothetical protein
MGREARTLTCCRRTSQSSGPKSGVGASTYTYGSKPCTKAHTLLPSSVTPYLQSQEKFSKTLSASMLAAQQWQQTQGRRCSVVFKQAKNEHSARNARLTGCARHLVKSLMRAPLTNHDASTNRQETLVYVLQIINGPTIDR